MNIQPGQIRRYKDHHPDVRPIYWRATIRILEYQFSTDAFRVEVVSLDEGLQDLVYELGGDGNEVKRLMSEETDATFTVSARVLRDVTDIALPSFPDTKTADEWMRRNG